MEWLGNCSDWITLQLGQLEEILSAPATASSGSSNIDLPTGDFRSEGPGFWSTLVSWSPLEALTFTKVQLEERLLDIHQFSAGVCQTTVNLSLTVFEQLSVGNFSQALELISDQSSEVVDWFELSEFQHKLIREFSLILVGNLALLCIAWRIYGRRISSRFLESPGDGDGRRVIQELRVSMSEL